MSGQGRGICFGLEVNLVLMPHVRRVLAPAYQIRHASGAIIVAIAGRVWKSHAQLARTCRRDGSGGEIGTSQCEHFGACSTLVASAKPDQSKDSAVRQAANNRELTKILVECNQDASFDAGCL